MSLSYEKKVRSPYVKSKSTAVINPYLKSRTTAIGSMSSVIGPTPPQIVVAIPSVTEVIIEEADLLAPPQATVSEMIENVLDHLGSKQLRNGYAMYIMEQNVVPIV